MMITAKSIQHSNIVVVLKTASLIKWDSSAILQSYSQDERLGVNLVEDPAMDLKILSLPAAKLKIILEQNRLRFEDLSQKNPTESNITKQCFEFYERMISKNELQAFGFNFDVFFRLHQVIPEREIMSAFVSKNQVEDIKDFGWQFSLKDPKYSASRSYFFKVISPLEIALHANIHFEAVAFPKIGEDLQKLFESEYEGLDKIFKELRI